MTAVFRVLITGTRSQVRTMPFDVYRAIMDAWESHGRPKVTVVHGACPTGVDLFAGNIGKKLGFAVEQHPADWDAHGKAAGPIRNQHMVDLGADLCLAFPRGESRGTRDCMRRAEAAGIPVEVHEIAVAA